MELENNSFTVKVGEIAARLGFSKIGFAKIEPIEREAHYFKEWLIQNHHGTMSWLEKSYSKRINPSTLLPEAKSVIVCALNYYHSQPDAHSSSGKISRYAWGDDYHVVIKDKLNELWKWIIEKKPDSKGVINVDSGPVMEKVWAKRAGIGWQGKNTIILNREFGSWMFLGTIVTDIEFEYDLPSDDLCGECTLCVKSCPTGALVDQYQLDANKCISYYTIEQREDVSKDISKTFGNWIFGCDICQDVCPWNQKSAEETNIAEFEPRDYSNGIEFGKILSMSEDDFDKLFNNSPISRRTLDGMKENVRRIYPKNE
jgi:epoxyqueuosine reductase